MCSGELFFSSWAPAEDRALQLQLPCHSGLTLHRTILVHQHHHRFASTIRTLGWCPANPGRNSHRVQECISQHHPTRWRATEHLVMQREELFTTAALATVHDSWARRGIGTPLPNHGDPSTPFRTRQQMLSKVWSEVFASPATPLATSSPNLACRNFAARADISGTTTHPC